MFVGCGFCGLAGPIKRGFWLNHQAPPRVADCKARLTDRPASGGRCQAAKREGLTGINGNSGILRDGRIDPWNHAFLQVVPRAVVRLVRLASAASNAERGAEQSTITVIGPRCQAANRDGLIGINGGMAEVGATSPASRTRPKASRVAAHRMISLSLNLPDTVYWI